MSCKASGQITVVDITDAYSVLLTSESYTFIGNTTGAPSGASCATQVVAYCGSQQCPKVTISTVTCPTGIEATISNNDTATPTITFTTTDTITAACEATIPVVVDGVTVNKKFSFAVAKTGAKGDTGATGKSIYKVTPQYYISTSKTVATGGSWSDTAPSSIAKGKYLWTRMKVTYMNPSSTEYTTAAYDSLTDSRIEQLKDSITLEVSTAKGDTITQIKMDDEGIIKLTGKVLADYIDTDQLYAKTTRITGSFQANNSSGTTYSTVASDSGIGASLMSGTADGTMSSTVSANGGSVTLDATGGPINIMSTDSVKINGYEPMLAKKDSNNYYGFVTPNKSDSDYVRTTSKGLIPYKFGGASCLGTSSWPFNNVYAKNVDAYSTGTQWRYGRVSAALKVHTEVDGVMADDAFYPATSYRAASGTWDTGIFNDILYFNYIADNDYTLGNNTRQAYFWINSNNTFGIGAYYGLLSTPDKANYYGIVSPSQNQNDFVRTPGNGLIPYKSGGASSLGTTAWPFNTAYINKTTGKLSGCGWVWGKDNAPFVATGTTSASAWWPIISTPSVSGDWSLGTISNEFDLTYTLRTDYTAGTNRAEARFRFLSSGNLTIGGTLSQSSDRNLKKDISPIPFDIIDKLEPIQFRMKENESDNRIYYGFIAQDVAQLLEDAGVNPETSTLVSYEEDEEGNKVNYSLAYTEFIPMLVKKCQDLQSQVDNMQQQIDELKALIINK